MTWWRCFTSTLHECCTNLSCAPFFLLALIFYSFYYCWPYTAQLPYHLTAAIVDEDHSPMSRRLVQSLRAVPQMRVVLITRNRAEAITAMQKETVVTIVGIPQNFERDVLAGVPTAMTLVGNGAFIVKSRASMTGASGPLMEAATAAIAEEMIRYGASPSDIAASSRRAPIAIIQPMYNNIAGYLNFVVPIVFMIIFQTLMLCGSAMLFHSLFNKPAFPMTVSMALASSKYLFAMQLPILLICFFWSLLVEGAIFSMHGINSFQNIPATICMGAGLSLAISSLGVLVGLLLRKSYFGIPAVVMSSIPSVFISGNLFPAQNIPMYMRALSWFLPSTPGSCGMLRASQAGASMYEILPYLWHLILLASFYFLLTVFVSRKIANKTTQSSFVY